MKIRTRIILGFGLLLGILVTMSAVFYWQSNTLGNRLAFATGKALTYAQVARNMKMEVMEGQHMIEEVASVNPQEFQGNLKTLEQIHTRFLAEADNLRVYYTKDDDKESLANLETIVRQFTVFYDLGLQMDKAYVAQGVKIGSQLMPRFNKEANHLLESLEAMETRENQRMMEAMGKVQDKLEWAKTTMPLFNIAGLLLGLLLAVVITRSITQPLGEFVVAMEELGKGHIEVSLKTDRNDELGHMAKVIQQFAEELKFGAVANLQKMAHGDLDFDVLVYDSRDVVGIALKQTSESLNALLGNIYTSTQQIGLGAVEMANAAQSLSQGAYEQKVSLDMITEAMNELTAKTARNAANASLVSQLTRTFKTNAEKGNEQMHVMVDSMGEINTSSKEISKVINMIDEIAFQTNLLSLNAAVEAARAGAYGKGFAVVADEVHNLATRSAKAAKVISELIESTVKKVQKGAETAVKSRDVLNELVTGVTAVVTLTEQIAQASNEQADDITQISQSLGQIDTVTNQNTATAEESASAAAEFQHQVEQLQSLVKQFRFRDETQQEEGTENPTEQTSNEHTALEQNNKLENLPALPEA